MGGAEPGPSWDDAPYPALRIDADGRAATANRSARALFPAWRHHLEDAVPEWLMTSWRTARPAGGLVAERSFEAHPVRHGDGSVTLWLVEDTDTRVAREALRLERARTALLSEVSSALLATLNLDRCTELAARLAAEHLADAALVVAPSSRSGFPVTHCRRGGEPVRGSVEADPGEVPGLGEALRGFPPVPSRWLDPAAAPAWLTGGQFGAVGSIVITPLPGHGVPAGALILLRGVGRELFTEDEEAFARMFAARAGAALSAARLLAQQATITETLMRDLLPPVLRQRGGVEFAGRYRAARDTERVGGDFYDVHDTAGGESLAVLGDVCGKGLEAAVLTGKIRTMLQALRPMAADHRRMLELVNGGLLDTAGSRFVTLVLASVRRSGEDVHLRLTAAGHLPPLIVRTDGAVEEVATRGSLIGVLPEIESTSAQVVLGPGDTCLLYTDGITEARGGPLGDEMFGEDRLRRTLAECGGLPAEAVVERIQMLASQWVARSSHDDMAVLAITAPRARRNPKENNA